MKSVFFTYCIAMLACISWRHGSAQIIMNDKCQAFTDQAYFNPDFIKRNKIRSIHGAISSKRTNDIIRDLGLVLNFDFDTEGRVVKQMYSHHSFGYRT
ncbi:MAG TPA: hypothetical protein VD905_19455, partial [Flavobacteriales bacterium]|nr:hypothetical protein [Flavobacteriales bacterium]